MIIDVQLNRYCMSWEPQKRCTGETRPWPFCSASVGGPEHCSDRGSRTGGVRLNPIGLRAAVWGLSAVFGDRRLRCFVWGWLVMIGGVWRFVGRVLGTVLDFL